MKGICEMNDTTCKSKICSNHNRLILEELLQNLRRDSYHAKTISNAVFDEISSVAKEDLVYILDGIIDKILKCSEKLCEWECCLNAETDMND